MAFPTLGLPLQLPSGCGEAVGRTHRVVVPGCFVVSVVGLGKILMCLTWSLW